MSNFICPVKGNVRLTSPFGWRTISGVKEWHQGVDLASTGKVPIYASADGVVIRVGALSTYGNVVMIRHNINGKHMETNYAHLSSYNVKVGQTVKQGQQIGVMGNTGRSFGIHLHFEIHNGAYAKGQPNAVNPMNYISLNNTASSNTKNVNVPYRIQSGTFNSKSEAEKAKSRVAKNNLANINYITIHEDNGKFYFQTGTYVNEATAKQYLQKMKDLKIIWVGSVVKA